MILVSITKNVESAQWDLQGALGQEFRYNDNIALTAIDPQSVVGYLLTPGVQASRKTQTWDTLFTGQGEIRRYDDSRWDCNNYNLALNSDYRVRRNNFLLNGGYGVNCAYTQQVSDTGILVPKSQNTNYRVAPAWRWRWTARDRIIAEGVYSNARYSNTGGTVVTTGFSGNEIYTANLGLDHIWNRRLSLNGGAFFSHIKYTGQNSSNQDLYGLQVGGNYMINRHWKTSAGGGLRLTNTQQDGSNTTATDSGSAVVGHVFNISLSYNDKLTNFSTGYSNALVPSAIGQTLQTHTVFANYAYRFTQHLALDISGVFNRSESIGGQSGAAFDRDYVTASTGLTWDFAKHWQLKGGYIYRWQNYPQRPNIQAAILGTADSNIVMLSVGYSWGGSREGR